MDLKKTCDPAQRKELAGFQGKIRIQPVLTGTEFVLPALLSGGPGLLKQKAKGGGEFCRRGKKVTLKLIFAEALVQPF